MEQQVNNVVNFGIGCVKAISERYEGVSTRIRNGVSELISDGEQSKDSVAVKIREIADKATGFLGRSAKTNTAA